MISPQMREMLAFLAERAKESSSHAGVVIAVLALFHVAANPDAVNAGLAVLAAVGGLVMVLLKQDTVVKSIALWPAVALMFAMSACAPAGAPAPQVISPVAVQKTQGEVASVVDAVDRVCGEVNMVSAFAAPFSIVPEVSALVAFGAASCGSAQAVTALAQKAVNDPETIAWAQDLAAKLQAAAAAAKTILYRL
jgi:hypothetical protein